MRQQKRSRKTRGPGSSPASGVTLTEVLMSLMIMSIGISAVAVLFPISVLRSVQATQMTNAAILKYNAEALVQMMPQVVFDPDGDGNLAEHLRNSTEQHYIVDPAGYFELAASGASYASFPTLSPGNVPSVPNDDTVRQLCDWFGNVDITGDGAPELLKAVPRYDGGIRFGTGLSPIGGEQTRALQMLSGSLTRLGDGWDTQFEGVPTEFVFADGSTGTSAGPTAVIVGFKFGPDVDLSGVATCRKLVPRTTSWQEPYLEGDISPQIIRDEGSCRVVVFSADGKSSIAFPLVETLPLRTSASPPPMPPLNVVLFSEDVDFSGPASGLNLPEDLDRNGIVDIRSVPKEFIDTTTGTFAISRILLQTSRVHDYNWILTVRRGSDGQCRAVDVVVTHNKGITPDDERVFPASFNKATSVTNNPFVIRVLKASGRKLDGDFAEPIMRRSGFVFDVVNCRWYRIRDYQEATVTVGSVTGPGYLVTLEQPVVQNALDGGAMFLPGVVDVFPMGPVTVPINQ